jgi:nucleoside 2-deoxyribosyltransferase
MQIYFSGSIRGMEPQKEWFQILIRHLKTYGDVLTEHSFSYSYDEEIRIDDNCIWERDIKWLKNSDVVVAEVSAPSLGVGYEIGKAEEWGKPIICLFRSSERKLSAMIGGSKNCVVKTFKEEKDAFDIIDDFLLGLKPT